MTFADLESAGVTIGMIHDDRGTVLTATTKENTYRFDTTEAIDAFVLGFLEGRSAPAAGHTIVSKEAIKSALGEVVEGFYRGDIRQVS